MLENISPNQSIAKPLICAKCKKEIKSSQIRYKHKINGETRYYHLNHAPNMTWKLFNPIKILNPEPNYPVYCPNCYNFTVIAINSQEPGEYYQCCTCNHLWNDLEYMTIEDSTRFCPHCQSTNYEDHGYTGEEDLNKPEYHIFKCKSCKKQFWEVV